MRSAATSALDRVLKQLRELSFDIVDPLPHEQ